MIHMDGEFMKQLNMKAAGVDLRPKAVAGRYDKSFANRLRADFKMNYELLHIGGFRLWRSFF